MNFTRKKAHPLLVITLIGALFTSCSEAPKTDPLKIEETESSLKDLLDKKKADFEAKADEEKKKIYAEGIESVKNSGIESSAKQVGETAPNFELKNANGTKVKLEEYLKKGPVVLTWYRGGWCPYCNITLSRLQAELPKFKAEGATLLALSPELPDKSLSTKEKHQLDFEVLSDVDNLVAKEYGIVYKLMKEVAAMYQKGFDLHSYNGNESDELPLSATYVIDQNGVIKYAFLDAEYRNRAEPKEILEVLKEIKKLTKD